MLYEIRTSCKTFINLTLPCLELLSSRRFCEPSRPRSILMLINAQECLLADMSLFTTNSWLCYSGTICSRPLEDGVGEAHTPVWTCSGCLQCSSLASSSQLAGWRQGREGELPPLPADTFPNPLFLQLSLMSLRPGSQRGTQVDILPL